MRASFSPKASNRTPPYSISQTGYRRAAFICSNRNTAKACSLKSSLSASAYPTKWLSPIDPMQVDRLFEEVDPETRELHATQNG